MLRHGARGLRHAQTVLPRQVFTRSLKQRAQQARDAQKILSSLQTVHDSSPVNVARKPDSSLAVPRREPRNPISQGRREQTIQHPDKVIDEAIPSALLACLEGKDVVGAKKYWDQINSIDMLDSFIVVHGEALSGFVKSLCWSGFVKPRKTEEVRVLEEIALVLAINGFPDSLRGIMRRYIRWSDSDGVYRLYEEFKELSGRNPTWAHADNVESSLADLDATAQDFHSDAADEFASTAEDEIVEETHGYVRNYLLTEMLMFAIAASALRNDFRIALQYTLQAKCLFNRAKNASIPQ